MTLLTTDQLTQELTQLDNWQVTSNNPDSISKKIECANFKQALELLNSIGQLAEQVNHHPDLGIENYKYLNITLSTHDQGGVTAKDLALATKIDQLLAKV